MFEISSPSPYSSVANLESYIQYCILLYIFLSVLPYESILVDVELEWIDSGNEEVHPEVKLTASYKIGVGNVALHQEPSAIVVFSRQLDGIVREENASTTRESYWLHYPHLPIFSFLPTPRVQTAFSYSHRLQNVLPLVKKAECFWNEIEVLFPKALPKLLVPPGNLQFAGEHLSPWHPVHLRLPIQVDQILTGSIGKQVAKGFLGACSLKDYGCSGDKRGKEDRAGSWHLAAGQSVSQIRPVSPSYDSFVFWQKMRLMRLETLIIWTTNFHNLEASL